MALFHCSACGEIDTSRDPLCEHLAPQFNIGLAPDLDPSLEALQEIASLLRELQDELRGLRAALVQSP